MKRALASVLRRRRANLRGQVRVCFTRDSVAAGDDVDAPHEKSATFADDAPANALTDWVVRTHYPAYVAGDTTWVVRIAPDEYGAGGRPVAVVRLEDASRGEPEALWVGEEAGSLAELVPSRRVHLEYVTDQDPVRTARRVSEQPDRTSYRLDRPPF